MSLSQAQSDSSAMYEYTGCEMAVGGDMNIEDVNPAKEAANYTYDLSKLGKCAGKEKVIFCIDIHMFQTKKQRILSILQLFYDLKYMIAARPVEFGILILGSAPYTIVPVPTRKHFTQILQSLYPLESEDNAPYDLSGVFQNLATAFELPDPLYYNKDCPPPHTYQVVFLFARNRFVPTLDSPNAFFFLVDNPFFTLDVIYMYRKDVKKSKHEKIEQALKGLITNDKCYFHSFSLEPLAQLQSALNLCAVNRQFRSSQTQQNEIQL